LGLKISALTFIGCIAYLFYDWGRGKEMDKLKELTRLNLYLDKKIF